MKKCSYTLILGTLLVLALVGQAAALDIHFCIDGPENCYCDGMYITNTGTGLLKADKVFHGFQTGCVAEAVAGAKAYNRMTRNWKYAVSMPSWDSFTIIRKNHTWTHYHMDGTVQNAGYWYYGPPPTEAIMGAPASFSAQ